MREALSRCIYVGQRGGSVEVNNFFICQVEFRPCMQVVRYGRGSRILEETGSWGAPRVLLNMNVLALQRDVLKGDEIISYRTPRCLWKEAANYLRFEKQIQIIDSKCVGTRWREDVDLRCRPLITSDEWRKLIVTGQIADDWEKWSEKEQMINGKLLIM